MSDAADDYLWNPNAAPDPDLVALESSLGGLRYAGSLPALPPRTQPRRSGAWTGAVAGLLAATGLLAAGLAAFGFATPELPSWELTALHTPQPKRVRLVQGRWLDTGSGRYRVQVANLGSVEVEPQSRVRLVETSPNAHRLELARGTLHAVVTAPPRLFVVDTPAAQAVDLGCAYTLDVDDSGNGMLTVTVGAVSLEAQHAAYVPAGARCATWSGGRVGTPVFVDADPTFLDCLAACDRLLTSPRADLPALRAQLARALPMARIEDSLSLIHLLPRLTPVLRKTLVSRLQDLAPLPVDLSEAQVLALDPQALAAWRESMEWSWGE